jgi:hypothetical protein
MSDVRARAALSYWRASRRLLLRDGRIRLSEGACEIILINHALDGAWPRLRRSAIGALVLLRRSTTARGATAAATCGGQSRSRVRRRRRRPD